MKIMKALCYACLFFILTSASCKKDKDPVRQLPPETQEGKGTFGCLIDGELFEPNLNPLSGRSNLNASYQQIYPTNEGMVLGLKATKNFTNGGLSSISIGFDSIKLKENTTYLLGNFKPGKGAASYSIAKTEISILEIAKTSETMQGELKITKLDEINRIIAGTFWFNVSNNQGIVIKITMGRFDVKYTK